MQSRLLRGPDYPGARLIVYCAGWGTDDAVIQHLQIPVNTDVLVCWDYRDLLSCYPRRDGQDKLASGYMHARHSSDVSCLPLDFAFQDYTECHLVAWSMGVWAAEQALADWPFQSACAINGTPYPKHAQWGIDPEVFDATLAKLDATGRHKFERRMCSNAAQLQAYQALPARPLDEIRAELQAIDAAIALIAQSQDGQALLGPIGTTVKTTIDKPIMHGDAACISHPKIAWTQAIISEQDRIIPTAHQLAYWQSHGVPISLRAGAHYLWDGFNSWEQLCRM